MDSILLRAFLLIIVANSSLWALPVFPEYENNSETFIQTFNATNGSTHDLYVIRTIIYEVGILTDADNDTDSSNETHERVDLTFYDPQHNATAINLSNIPVPIRTNISGEIITGLAPVNFGVISLPSELSENGTKIAGYLPLTAPILPNVLIGQTTNVSTSDPEQEKKIIEGLPEEIGV